MVLNLFLLLFLYKLAISYNNICKKSIDLHHTAINFQFNFLIFVIKEVSALLLLKDVSLILNIFNIFNNLFINIVKAILINYATYININILKKRILNRD